MRRTRNLTVATMVDIAFFLGLKLDISISSAESWSDNATYSTLDVMDWWSETDMTILDSLYKMSDGYCSVTDFSTSGVANLKKVA